MDIMELEALMRVCQRNGVTEFSDGKVTLRFGQMSQSSETEPVDISPKVSEPLRGADSLTAQEQLELYGRVYDAKG